MINQKILFWIIYTLFRLGFFGGSPNLYTLDLNWFDKETVNI